MGEGSWEEEGFHVTENKQTSTRFTLASSSSHHHLTRRSPSFLTLFSPPLPRSLSTMPPSRPSPRATYLTTAVVSSSSPLVHPGPTSASVRAGRSLGAPELLVLNVCVHPAIGTFHCVFFPCQPDLTCWALS